MTVLAMFLRIVPRTAALIFLVILGTTCLVHWAPGYYNDARELDASGGAAARRSLDTMQRQDRGVLAETLYWIRLAARGDFGKSRQFEVPVTLLLKERVRPTVSILVEGVVLGWLGAGSLSLGLASIKRQGLHDALLAPTSWLLVFPVGALAALCFLADFGGPILVIALLVGARELQFFTRLLRTTLGSSHFLYLRASGIRHWRLLWACALPQLLPQLLSLLLRSLLVAVAMAVPVEVVFDEPGLGQLAWSAAMNRDLPVLMAVTLLFAACLIVGGTLADAAAEEQAA